MPTLLASGASRLAVIVDDEPMAREALRGLIHEVPWMSCVGEAGTCHDAVAAIDRIRPDVVFLDIQMPGGTGIDVLDRVRHRPLVVFTTAHDRYAVEAFDRAATDYLLKPFGDRRFRQTVERIEAALGPVGSNRGEWVFLSDRGTRMKVPVSDLVCLSAEDDYVRLRTSRSSYLEYGRLHEFVARLGDDRFLRVHRSHAVNRDWIVRARPAGVSGAVIELRDGTSVLASRRGWRKARWAFE